MKRIITKELIENLMIELQRLEDEAMKSENKELLNIYFPHTLYEVRNIMENSIGQEINFKW